MQSMNAIGIIVLAALIMDFTLRIFSDCLNLRAARDQIPEGFEAVYPPDRYRRSQDYLRTRTRFGWCSAAVFLLAILTFWFGGGFEALDRWVRGFNWNPVVSGMLYIGTLALLRSVLALPFRIYATFVIEKGFGFNTTDWKTFVADGFKAALIFATLGGAILCLVLGLFEYVGTGAWLFCWMGVSIMVVGIQFVAPRWILPLFNSYKPIEDGDLRSAILRYARSIDVPLENILVMDGSRRTTKSNAFFTGFGSQRRAVLFDTLVGAHSISETLAVIAHEMGHYKKHHILKSLAVGVLHMGIIFFLFSLVASSRELFAAFQVERMSIYSGLVFFALLYTPLDLALGVLLKAQSRRHECEADCFAVETTGNPKALSDALKKLSSHNLANLTPHPFYVALHYSHPPLLKRIRAIEDLKD